MKWFQIFLTIVAAWTSLVSAFVVRTTTNAGKASAMLALEAATFTNGRLPTSQETYNAWNLHVCVFENDAKYSIDRTLLRGHPTVTGIKMSEITFEMCNQAYIGGNTQCLLQYNKYMENWPKQGTDWPFLTSSTLPNCIATCDAEAARHHELLSEERYKPPNFEQEVDFAFCFKHVSQCSLSCLREFNDEIIEFQKKHDN